MWTVFTALNFKKWGYNLGPKDFLYIIYNVFAILAIVVVFTQLSASWEWLDSWEYTTEMHTLSGLGCILLSLVLVIAAFVTMIRIFAIARTIQKTVRWYSKCGCRTSVNKVLYGMCFGLAILSSMKFWSVTDSIYVHWLSMPHEYHIRAYIYLVENYTVVIVYWVVATYFARVSECAVKPRMYLNEEAINILTCIKNGYTSRSGEDSFAKMMKDLSIQLRLGVNEVTEPKNLKKFKKAK